MGKLKIAIRSAIAAAAMCAAVASAAETASEPSSDVAARRLLADRLLNDARSVARSSIPPSLAARQAMLILQNARNICPDSLEVLHALAEAAREAGERELLRDTLRQIIKLDSGDFVAQVNLLTAIAENTQTIEEQARVYAATLEKDSFDPQVRSEIALRYARLMIQRGELDQARTLLDTAVKLNDVNSGAWQEIIRLQANGPVRVNERMATIVSSLLADPYPPQVWLAGGRALAATNQHDLAAAFLGTAVDGATRQGAGSGELILEWATELAIAGDPRAATVLAQLAKLEDAPPGALIASLAVSGPSVTAVGGVDPVIARIRTRAAESVKAAPENKTVLADASWVEIFYMPALFPEATEYLDRLAKVAGEDDDVVKLRRGWLLLQNHEYDKASRILTPISGKDPFAQLGIARIAAAQGDKKSLEFNLQDLYNTHPTGLLALHILADARKYKVTLKDTPLGAAVRKAAIALPTSVFTAPSNPRDVMLIMPTISKRRYGYGEPIPLTLKIANTTDRALSVGPDAAIKTSIGIAAAMREPAMQNIGLYAMDNAPRVYRLAPRGSYNQTIRLDEDNVYEMFSANAWKTYTLGVTVITDPKLTREGVLPGVGGQVIAAGEFSRDAVQLSKMEDASKMADALSTLPPERQMIVGTVLAGLLPELTDEKIGNGPGSAAAKAAREKITSALIGVIRSQSPVIKAWFLRMLPENVSPLVADALEVAARSSDLEPRLAGLQRKYATSHPTDAAARKALAAQFLEAAQKENDPLLKDYAATLAEISIVPPPAPPSTSTAPGTAPAVPPASVPAVDITLPATAPATSPAGNIIHLPNNTRPATRVTVPEGGTLHN